MTILGIEVFLDCKMKINGNSCNMNTDFLCCARSQSRTVTSALGQGSATPEAQAWDRLVIHEVGS